MSWKRSHEKKNMHPKKVQLGNKKIESAVFAALLRPIATMSVRQKNVFGTYFEFP